MPKKRFNFKEFAKKKVCEEVENLWISWKTRGYDLEIDNDILFIKKDDEKRDDFITVDLEKQEIWFDEWISHDIFNLLCKTLKILDWSKEDE